MNEVIPMVWDNGFPRPMRAGDKLDLKKEGLDNSDKEVVIKVTEDCPQGCDPECFTIAIIEERDVC